MSIPRRRNPKNIKPEQTRDGDPYERVSRSELYRNAWLAVEKHRITHPTGQSGEHLLVVTPQSCAIVVQDGGDLLFALQPRFAARREVVEIVKGGCAPGELPLDCAKRELKEELGIVARDWRELGTLHEIPSIVEPPVMLFCARDVAFAAPEPEREESISVLRLKVKDALRAAATGEIDDAVTVAALFRFGATEGCINLI